MKHRDLLVLCLIAVTACAGGTRPGTSGPGADVLTRAELENATQPNAFEVVRHLRPHWLQVRGGGSLRGRMVKRVYLDELYLGGVEELRQINTPAIESIRYYDGPAATQRWGSGHSAGAIQIETRQS
jgi:hypothetical protein